MSEVISFNTENSVKEGFSEIKSVDIFALVDENDPILGSITTEFDFEHPPVDPNWFASQLAETCKIKSGFGLSANQCGYNYRVFVMGSGDEYVAMFNPKIKEQSDEHSLITEGCLSFPMLALKISRPKSIDVEYHDFRGEKHEVKFEGLTAHVFQHELDHLNGICYTERAKPMALKMGLKKRGKFKKLVDRYETAQKKINSVM